MGNDAGEVVQVLRISSDVKAHGSMCRVLREVLDRIGCILPAIESARPGCTSGIKELCSLYNTIDKAKLLLQHCAESSKLYLAITADATLSRCERIRIALDQSLCQMQSMVPQPLIVQISDVVTYIRDTKFVLDSADEEAGKSMLELLQQTESSEKMEFEAFQIAAFVLNITSPKSLLIERRSIKKLLDKIHGIDPKKERILRYFLYLLKKYGKKLMSVHNDPMGLISSVYTKCNTYPDEPTYHDDVWTDFRSNIPPEELCCPISSRLMYDPVIIASGQTYEKMCIEKWFNEGNDTCPKTRKKLEVLTMIPNSCMKDLISQWCLEHGLDVHDLGVQNNHSLEITHCNSISSLKNVSVALLDGNSGDHILQRDHSNLSSISSDASYCSDSPNVKDIENSEENNHADIFPWSDDYQNCGSFCNFDHDMYMRFFDILSELPIELQGIAGEDFKNLVKDDEHACDFMLSNGFDKALMKFLKNTNVQAWKIGAEILLSFLSSSRVDIPSPNEDAFRFLSSLLDSDISAQALLIMQKLVHEANFIAHIEATGLPPLLIKVLESEDTEFLELAVKLLYDLSFRSEIKSHISSSRCIYRLVPLLNDRTLVEYCMSILRNLCDGEDAARAIAETNGCIASIVEVLEIGTRKEQEEGVGILLSLCCRSSEYCRLVSEECVVPPLVYISMNGSDNAKESSRKLLHLLRDLGRSDC